MQIPALILLDQEHWDNVFGKTERKRLEGLISTPLRFHSPQSIAEKPGDLRDAEVIFSGWGMPLCDESFLNAAPRLKAIFHAAGTIRYFITEAVWERGIVVSSANSVLAITVAEYTLAQILLSLKLMWRHASEMRATQRRVRQPVPGIYDSVVGLISVGAVARHLITLLRPFKLRIVAYDPFVSQEAAQELGIEMVSLDELFEISDVVSLHTPELPETLGMIRGHHFSRMRKDGTFINTARGALVREKEMIEVLKKRPDLHVLLDVTHPEPPVAGSPLYTLPNVILTPHIAGTLNKECRRLGAMAVDEFERYLHGDPLHGEICQEMMQSIA